MTYVDLTNPFFGPPPVQWNGPYCPNCGKSYIQPTTTTGTFRYPTEYKPKHRKPGPAL